METKKSSWVEESAGLLCSALLHRCWNEHLADDSFGRQTLTTDSCDSVTLIV